MRKLEFCIRKNKGADQLRSHCAADQRLCFRHIVTKIPHLSKSKISKPLATFKSRTEQPGLCQTWLDTRQIFQPHDCVKVCPPGEQGG